MSTARDKTVLNMILNPLMPNQDFDIENQDTDDQFSNLPNAEECKRLEVEGIKLAEDRKFDEALGKFNEAIIVCPNNPSPYNNRAQVLRFQEKIEEAIADLNKAIELSEGKGKSAAQAYSQRALIYQLRNDNDLAREDYEKASKLGSNFAKMQLVALNPYAAMCNAMLSEVLAKTQQCEDVEKKKTQ